MRVVFELDRRTDQLSPSFDINQRRFDNQNVRNRGVLKQRFEGTQAENLVDAQFQYRTRVTNVTSQEVDSVYATWILMQSLGIALTVPLTTKPELTKLRQALEAMNDVNGEIAQAIRSVWERQTEVARSSPPPELLRAAS